MHNYMFRSRMGALVFAALVILGAVSMVGTEEESGTLVESGDVIARQKAAMDADIARGNAASEAEEAEIYEDGLDGWDEGDDSYFSEEELIDDTSGESTEPMVDTTPDSFDVDQTSDEVILVTDE